MCTTNDAHKYLREPPTVKPFPIKYSSATHRKIGEGLILDSSVLTAGERRGESLSQIQKGIFSARGPVDCALSVVTIVELTQGIYRAKSDDDRKRRLVFSEELRQDLIVYSVTGRSRRLQAALRVTEPLTASALPSKTC